MQDAVSEYESTKSNLQNINSELEEQNQRINELLTKGHLTYTEKDELKELQAITKELLLQKDIEERRAAAESREVAKTTVDAYNTQYGGNKVSQEYLDKAKETFKDNEFAMHNVKEDNIAGNITAYQLAEERRQERQEAYETAINEGGDIQPFYDALQYSIKQVDEFETRLDNHMITLQESRLALEEEYQNIKKRKNTKNLSVIQKSKS